MPVVLRFSDPDSSYTAVRLSSDLSGEAFTRVGDEWVLELELPDVLRLEYKLEVFHPDGGNEWILDPGNPKRTPGAFGEKSVLELPGYAAPAWLDAETVPGRIEELVIRGRGLGSLVGMRVWSPADVSPGTPLRMLLANDGPEYDAMSSLTRFSAAKIAAGELPPHRVALIAPGDRNQWYSASAAYARVLASDVVPALRDTFGLIGTPAAMGASLGALAMLHAQRRFPRALRRALPAVRLVLHPALRLAGERLRPLRADHPLRPRDRARRAVRDARPDDDHRRPRGGERAQQSRNGACPGRTGVRRVPGGGGRPA